MRAASTTERRLIVNADDYGISAGVNDGILEVVQAGVVTSISVMVTPPAFAAGMARLHHLPTAPSVGLHLDLTAGVPVSPVTEVPSLVDGTGAFHRLSSFVMRALAGRIRPAEVERETQAQLARLRSAWPDVGHLDSHQHVHALPAVGPAVGRAAHGLSVRRPVEPAWQTARGGSIKRLFLAGSCRLAGARAEGPANAVRGIGMHGERRYLEELLAIVNDLPAGRTELIVHPGRRDASIAPLDPYDAPREAELAALLSEVLRARLQRGDIVLEGFGTRLARPA